MINIRKAVYSDLDNIMDIIADAKAYLKASGSLQWQTGYPDKETILADIKKGQGYVALDNNITTGYVVLFNGIDENYDVIYDGSWSDLKYISIHRICVKAEYRGKKISDELMKYALSYAKNNHIPAIKIDTHRLNIPMQRLCLKYGFIYKGIIHIKREKTDFERLAYELIL